MLVDDLSLVVRADPGAQALRSSFGDSGVADTGMVQANWTGRYRDVVATDCQTTVFVDASGLLVCVSGHQVNGRGGPAFAALDATDGSPQPYSGEAEPGPYPIEVPATIGDPDGEWMSPLTCVAADSMGGFHVSGWWEAIGLTQLPYVGRCSPGAAPDYEFSNWRRFFGMGSVPYWSGSYPVWRFTGLTDVIRLPDNELIFASFAAGPARQRLLVMSFMGPSHRSTLAMLRSRGAGVTGRRATSLPSRRRRDGWPIGPCGSAAGFTGPAIRIATTISLD